MNNGFHYQRSQLGHAFSVNGRHAVSDLDPLTQARPFKNIPSSSTTAIGVGRLSSGTATMANCQVR